MLAFSAPVNSILILSTGASSLLFLFVLPAINPGNLSIGLELSKWLHAGIVAAFGRVPFPLLYRERGTVQFTYLVAAFPRAA